MRALEILYECRKLILGQTMIDDVDEAIEELENLLEREVNLCESCNESFSICKSDPVFGNGLGNDNIIRCQNYINNKDK